MPLRRENGELIVGMVNPGDLRAVDDLRALLDERFTRVPITPTQLADLLGERRKLDQEVNNVAQIVVDDSFEEQTRTWPRCAQSSRKPRSSSSST